MDPDIIRTIDPLLEVFSKQKIEYLIGGSVASSLFGFVRATHDIDVVAKIRRAQVKPLAKQLESTYLVSEPSMMEAIRNESSFNLIHLETLMKVDVFVLKNHRYHQQAFKRKIKDHLDEHRKESEYFLETAEDVVLNKLTWYKLGGCVSDRQWNDLIGVLKVQQHQLDKDYLLKWAGALKVLDLLQKAFEDSGFENPE